MLSRWVMGCGVAALALSAAGCGEDTPPPLPFDHAFDTVLDGAPDAYTSSGQSSFAFHATSTADGVTFGCRIDDVPPVECTSPFMVDVGAGPHVFVVTAFDQFGRPDETPPIATWVVDQTAPDVTLEDEPAPLDSSTIARFTFGSADPSVTFECQLDGGPFEPCTSPWSTTVTDGDHTVVIRAIDEAGNVSPTPITRTWTVDSSLPETVLDDAPSGLVGPDVTFEFSAPDVSTGAHFACFLDGQPVTPCASPLHLVIGDGPHVFQVVVTSPSGAIDPSPATQIFTVDATGPALSIDATPGDLNYPAVSTFAFSSDPDASTSCAVDDGVAEPCSSPFTTDAVAPGPHSVTVFATDGVGNVSSQRVDWHRTEPGCGDGIVSVALAEVCDAGDGNTVAPTHAFTAAGAMPVAVRQQYAVSLLDGRVLIVGVVGGGAESAAAMIYDPATGAFSSTGTPVLPRVTPTVTMLADGRVLIAGGFVSGVGDSASAELYDLSTGTFHATGSMAVAREGHAAARLPDGRVLIIGGFNVSGTELYDPTTETFSSGPSLTTGSRFDHYATALLDGRILVYGGVSSNRFKSTCEIYDPSTNSFAATGSMVIGRAQGAAVRLADGRVLVTGGSTNDNADGATAELYDPAAGTFALTGRMTARRLLHTATTLADGRVLLVGGRDVELPATSEYYDPVTETFTPSPPLSSPRSEHTATLLADGTVLIAGGLDGSLNPTATSEAFDPTPAPLCRPTCQVAGCGDGIVDEGLGEQCDAGAGDAQCTSACQLR